MGFDVFGFDAPAQPVALRFGEPTGIGRLLGEEPEHHEGEQDRWRAFEDEHPLPAVQAQVLIHALHDPARQRCTEHHRERNADHEPRHGLRPVAARKPVREVVDDSRKEARLGRSQQEAEEVEAPEAVHEHHAHGDDSPRDHDARDPHTRAETRQQQVAGHLAQRVTQEKEEAETETERCFAESEVRSHLQLREADIDAVQPRHDVQQQQEGQQPPGDFAHGGAFENGRVFRLHEARVYRSYDARHERTR